VRIVSLLPSATEIVFELGLGDELVGRTHECDYPPEAAEIPVMTADVSDLVGASNREIHERVTASLAGGQPIYRLDVDRLREADPDLVLTQELCDVCAVPYHEVTEAARALGDHVSVVSLEPSSIEGMFNTISTVGAMADAEEEAVDLLESLRERLARIEDRVLERRLEGIEPMRVVALEWIDPPFAAGHWVPEQVRRAGGWELLGREGDRSLETSWDRVLEVDPDMLLLMPCGFDAFAAAHQWRRSPLPESWEELRAVRLGQVIALDSSSYFSRPGPRLIDGIGLLAELFDPGGFRDQAPSEAWVPLIV
jgi:iron complex transport system substrate-binding protein